MNEDVIIVDYGMGNINSIKNMLRYLGYTSEISNDYEKIMNARKLILPGVGHFGSAMDNIVKLGLKSVLDEAVLNKRIPILGICLGMQLLLEASEEGNCNGLGWIEGNVRKFDFIDKELKVPHMGWDYIDIRNNNSLLKDIDNDSRFYFVHSFYASCKNKENVLATTDYGINFDSVIYKDNIFGTQFHPEKSHKFGMRILDNYMRMEI